MPRICHLRSNLLVTHSILSEEYHSAALAFIRLSHNEVDSTLAPESLFMAIQSYFNAAEYVTAYSACQEFLQKYPQHSRVPEIEYQLGRISFSLKDYPSAVTAFDRFLMKYPTDPLYSSAFFWKAESYYQMGNVADSFSLFEEVIAKWPDTEKSSLARWRLNVMGFEAREAKLLRITEYESQKKASTELYQFAIDAINENRYLKWYNAYQRLKLISQAPTTMSQSDIATIEKNRKLSLLLEAKQKALNLLISRIKEYLQGLSR